MKYRNEYNELGVELSLTLSSGEQSNLPNRSIYSVDNHFRD